MASKQRRSTDHPPLSNIVTKGNLDDRLDTVQMRIDGLVRLADERWIAHKEAHEAVEQSLRDYKRDANEWRATLADLRGTFLPKNEFSSEHRALDAKLHGEIQALAGIVATLDSRIDTNTGDLRTLNTEQQARRGLFSDTRSIITAIVAIIGGIATFLLILDRLRP